MFSIFHPNHVILRLDLTFISKVNSFFHRVQELILPYFCPNPSHPRERLRHMLDVRRPLHIYMKRTASFQKTEAMFISFHQNSLGQKVSSSSTGRWIRATIFRAYSAQGLPALSYITAHSTCSAATTAAWTSQATVEEI
uniref:Uncharacterized protein n=1 Tax=Micrurus carvalhoi TaxID=3147026 RepID=A0A2H6N6S4_9SAUR